MPGGTVVPPSGRSAARRNEATTIPLHLRPLPDPLKIGCFVYFMVLILVDVVRVVSDLPIYQVVFSGTHTPLGVPH